MEPEVVMKLTVTPEEIVANRIFTCQISDCGERFTNTSNLQMHLTKHHKLSSSMCNSRDSTKKQFYCPIQCCMYNVLASGINFFTSFRSLKQHYLKMHCEKHFECNRCPKSFATGSLLRAHQTNCGNEFICKVCSHSYGSREALLTHTRRKNHGYKELLAEKSDKRKVEAKQKPNKIFRHSSTHSVKANEKEQISVRKSRTTQTELQRKLNECSTQTTKLEPSSSFPTCTSTTDSFCQTTLEQLSYFDDSKMNYFDAKKICEGHQCEAEPVVCVCSETQTELIYDTMFPNEDRADPMLYSHMYTQTCDDIFSELGLATIETQTNWNGLGEFLVSTETQTLNLICDASESNLNAGNQNGEERISSIQTQTSATMEFLNAISSESNSIHTQTS
ncbi:ATM interactor [Wyeomyia smithii]|uniref:ATM interactor n=1 Tax=Wyeomyia smithii TaxID=174621 RepID=UPI002467C4BA|nr:ATM interactor [Wyeomyia smithii]